MAAVNLDEVASKAPGVYVFEVPPAVKAIAGVSTSTAGFIGIYASQSASPPDPPAPEAPKVAESVPMLYTNFSQFREQFGGELSNEATAQNYLAHAVYGFFNNGGGRCYVSWVSAAKLDDALREFAAIDEIALVVAPGADPGSAQKLAEHCEGIKDRFAILDGPKDTKPAALPASLTVTTAVPGRNAYAALYYPWIKVVDPKNPKQLLDVPPSGHIAGIYARVDSERGVHKAPANEAIRGARDVTQRVSKADQDGLNVKGVNCIRVLNNNVLVWGARTWADVSKQDLKYINVRRTLMFLRKSIDQGTQWVVFEPNTRALWKKITRNVTAFLTDMWRSGALFGDTPQEAFYVRCDDEINPPSVREKGCVVTEIGVAIARPAEFVVFQISQFTAPA